MDDEKFLACGSCGQEVHKQCFMEKLFELRLITENEKPNLIFLQLPGFHYLCGSCEADTIMDVSKNNCDDISKSRNDDITVQKPNTQRNILNKTIEKPYTETKHDIYTFTH